MAKIYGKHHLFLFKDLANTIQGGYCSKKYCGNLISVVDQDPDRVGSRLFRARIADFLSTTVEPSCEKEGDKKERRTSEKRIEEGDTGLKMVHMQHASWRPPPLSTH